jgi:amidase
MAGQAVEPKANHKRLKMQKKWAEFWDSSGGYDVLLCPVTPTAAIKIDESGGLPGMATRTMVINGQERNYMDNIRWAGLTIIADLPATVVPIGVLESSGLPVGVQIVAPAWQDKTAIEVGRMLEKVHQGPLTPPGYAAASSVAGTVVAAVHAYNHSQAAKARL